MKRHYFLILVLLFFYLKAQGQDQTNFTQFFLNPHLLNPSYVGIDGRAALSFIYRKQWATIQDGPQISNVSFHAPISRRVSLGISATNDVKGLLNTSGAMLTFGYNVPLSSESFVRFGLSGGISSNTVDFEKLQELNDVALGNLLENNNSLTGNAGLSFHLKTFHAGFSLPVIFEPSYISKDAFSITEIKPFQTIIFHFSNRFYFNNNKNIFEPYAIYRMSSNLPPQFEIAGILHLNHVIWVGGSLKEDFGISALGGIKLKNTLAIGASYSLKNTGENDLNSPTYEVSLGLLLGKNKKDAPVYSFVNTEKEKKKKGTGKSASEMLAEKHIQDEIARKKAQEELAKKKQQEELAKKQQAELAKKQQAELAKKQQEDLAKKQQQEALAKQTQPVQQTTLQTTPQATQTTPANKTTTPVTTQTQPVSTQNQAAQQQALLQKQREDAAKQQQEDLVRKQQEETALRQQQELARKQQEEAALKQQQELARKQQEEAALKQQQDLTRKQQEDAALKQQQELARKQQEEAARKQAELAAAQKKQPEPSKTPVVTETKPVDTPQQDPVYTQTIRTDTVVIKHRPRFNHVDASLEVLNIEITEHTDEDELERITRIKMHAGDPDEHHEGDVVHPNSERHEFAKRGEHKQELDVSDYVITGVFRSEENAKRFTDGLKKLGFKAKFGHLTEKTVWYVYLIQTDDINVARTERDRYRKMKIFRDAWLLTVHH